MSDLALLTTDPENQLIDLSMIRARRTRSSNVSLLPQGCHWVNAR
jgi:hypothetical protein